MTLKGYLPCNKLRRDTTLERKRNEYFNFVEKYYDDKLYKKNDEELATLRQVRIYNIIKLF